MERLTEDEIRRMQEAAARRRRRRMDDGIRTENGELILERLNVMTIHAPGHTVKKVEPINEQELVKLKIRKVNVLDGVTANRRLTKKILGRGLIVNDADNPNIYIIDRNLDEKLKGRLAHISKIVEGRMEKTLPKHIFTFKKPVIQLKDCKPINTIDDVTGYSVAEIPDGIPVFVYKKRDSITFYKITNDGMQPMEIERYFENVVNDLEDHVTFFCAFVGVLVKKKDWYSELVLVDYINNGVDLSKIPYIDRHYRLHEMGTLLVSDAFSVVKLRDDIDGALEEARTGDAPFYMVDINHVNDGNIPLFTPAAFKETIDKNPGKIVMGTEPVIEHEDELTQVTKQVVDRFENEETAPVNSVKGKKICVTGRWKNDLNREDVQKLVEKDGGTWARTVNTKTDLLVIGNNPGKKKIEDATKLGVTMISMDEYLKITAGNT